jgi:hypothetical protein
MHDVAFNLKEFFTPESKHSSADIRSRMEMSDRILSLREKVSAAMGKSGWAATAEEISRKTTDLLDLSVVDLLVGSWNTYQGLKKYLDREKYSPTQSILVPLAEHTVHSEHHPYLEIFVKDERVGTISFEIRLMFTARGVMLLVQGGMIKGIKTGEIKGKGSLRCEGALLLEQDFRSIPLPGSINLEDGLQIQA